MTFAETVISVPIWDSDEQSNWTLSLIDQMCNQNTMRGNFHLVLVDNASPSLITQQALCKLADSGPEQVTVLRNEKNEGYGKAANRGIFYGLSMGAEYGIILNNDITIQDPDWLENAFISHLRKNPKQLMGARYIDFNGNAMYDGKHVTPYLEGWCLAFHRLFVENVGLFDSEIFNWHEDAELCIRAMKQGYALTQSPAFEWNGLQPMIRGPIIHAKGQTGFAKLDHQAIAEKSRKHVCKKHFGC